MNNLKKFILILFLQTFLAPPVVADQITDLLTGKKEESAASIDKTITTKNTALDDNKIRIRLQEIFSELDELQDITLDVSNGVVELQGSTISNANKSKARQLASQVEGVVEVKDEISVTLNLTNRLQKTGQQIQSISKQILNGLPIFLIALFVFLMFWLFGQWVSKRKGFYKYITLNNFIGALLGQITHLLFIIIGLVVALMLLDATALIGTILGAAGVVGLAVGFAVRDTVENYIASVLLSLRNPFDVNDYVLIDGHKGNVVRLTSRATILISPDANHIRIPNATVFKSAIVNYTRLPERRFHFDVKIAKGEDILHAQAVAIDTLNRIFSILKDPKPSVLVTDIGDWSISLRLYGWVDQTDFSLSKVRGEAIREIKSAFDNDNIEMPNPIYKIRTTDSDNTTSVSDSNEEKNENKTDSPKLRQHGKPAKVHDVSVDRAVEDKVEEEHKLNEHENLLDDGGPQEF